MRDKILAFAFAALLIPVSAMAASDMDSFTEAKKSEAMPLVEDSMPADQGNDGVDVVSGVKLEQPKETAEFRKNLVNKLKPVLGHIDSQEAADLNRQFRNNPEIQGMIRAYTANVWETLDQQARETPGGIKPPDKAASEQYMAEHNVIDEYTGRHVYIFVSDSMPSDTIDNYVDTIAGNPNFVIVLRGPIGGKAEMMPTVDWVSHHICGKSSKELMESKISNPDEAGCKEATISIDSNLFDKFRVTQVPAIVYVPTVETSMKCNNQFPVEESEYFSFFGDVPVDYALNKIRMALPEDQRLAGIITSLSGNPF